jgi:hypothetical protein
MSEELKVTTNKIMGQIRNGRYKMRPRAYFLAGSVFAMIGLGSSVVVSVFFTSLMSFVFRSHGPMGDYRLQQLLSNFPWWALIAAIIGLVSGALLLRRYEFSYKNKLWVIITALIATVAFAGWGVDASGLDELWLSRRPMQGIMRQYRQENGIQGQRNGQNQGVGAGSVSQGAEKSQKKSIGQK